MCRAGLSFTASPAFFSQKIRRNIFRSRESISAGLVVPSQNTSTPQMIPIRMHEMIRVRMHPNRENFREAVLNPVSIAD